MPSIFSRLTWMICELAGKWLYSFCFGVYDSRICSKQYAASLCRFQLALSPGVSLKSRWCNLTVVLTRLQLERILVLVHRRDQISIMVVNVPGDIFISSYLWVFQYTNKVRVCLSVQPWFLNTTVSPKQLHIFEHQFRSTSKNLHSSTQCEHLIPSREFFKTNDR